MAAAMAAAMAEKSDEMVATKVVQMESLTVASKVATMETTMVGT